jgi:hypothetical protein
MSNFKHSNPNETARDATVILRNISRDVRDHFKAFAAKRGKTMTELVVGFMRECVEKDSNPRPKKKRKHEQH